MEQEGGDWPICGESGGGSPSGFGPWCEAWPIFWPGKGRFTMSATYAHIALVDCLLNGIELDSIGSLTKETKHALLDSVKYVELGAVSPDYPFLNVLDANSQGWGNVMHFAKTADFVRCAIPGVATLIEENSPEKWHAVAWLFGYVAHLVTDMSVHPIVFLKVGDYPHHKFEHRRCELHQDVYIFPTRLNVAISEADFLKRGSGGIGACVDGERRFNPVIAKIWKACLLENTPLGSVHLGDGVRTPTSAPDPGAWHEKFLFAIDKIAEEGAQFPPLTRYFLTKEALCYPEVADPQFIENLETPQDTRVHYDVVFDRALKNVKEKWDDLGRALNGNRSELFDLPNSDLDTGRDESGKMIFWEVKHGKA